MTLDQFLKDNANKHGLNASDYKLTVWSFDSESVTFYIHPNGRDGSTVYFQVKGNEIKVVQP